MTQGLTPAAAISIILRRMWFGNGLPLMNTPPNWFTRPCPSRKDLKKCVNDILITSNLVDIVLFITESLLQFFLIHSYIYIVIISTQNIACSKLRPPI